MKAQQVGVLFVLNLTVTEGAINGLIFYANVIAMSRIMSTLKETSYLYTFLAWLNLDLGIGTCLFDGMDGYTATWLQFVFPVYLWMIDYSSDCSILQEISQAGSQASR